MLSGRIIAADLPPQTAPEVTAQAIDDVQELELVGDDAAAQAVTDVVQEFTPEELQAMAHEDDIQALAVDDTTEFLGEEPEFTADDDEVQAMAIDETAEFLGDEPEFIADDDEVQAMAVDDYAEFLGDAAHVSDDSYFFGDEAYFGDEAQADANGMYQGASQQGMEATSAVGIFVGVVLFVSLFVIAFALYIIRQEKAPAELI